MIVASVKGFGPGPYEECKVYEMSPSVLRRRVDDRIDDGPPLVTVPKSATAHRLHLALGIVAHSINATRRAGTEGARRDARWVLNLCRVKFSQQRLDRTGVMKDIRSIPMGNR